MATRKTYPRVELIPWDPTDEGHFQRMYEQRVACTWDYESVAGWKDMTLSGEKMLYWVVSPGLLLTLRIRVRCMRG